MGIQSQSRAVANGSAVGDRVPDCYLYTRDPHTAWQVVEETLVFNTILDHALRSLLCSNLEGSSSRAPAKGLRKPRSPARRRHLLTRYDVILCILSHSSISAAARTPMMPTRLTQRGLKSNPYEVRPASDGSCLVHSCAPKPTRRV